MTLYVLVLINNHHNFKAESYNYFLSIALMSSCFRRPLCKRVIYDRKKLRLGLRNPDFGFGSNSIFPLIPTHQSYSSVCLTDGAARIFFHSPLFASPIISCKTCKYTCQQAIVRESACTQWWGKERRKKKPTKIYLRMIKIWTHSLCLQSWAF